MLIRKIQLKFEKSNLQKKKSWVTKFGDLTTFLPINRSFQHIHKGGQFCTSGENTKNPNPKNSSLSNQPVAPSWPKTKSHRPPGFDFSLPSPAPLFFIPTHARPPHIFLSQPATIQPLTRPSLPWPTQTETSFYTSLFRPAHLKPPLSYTRLKLSTPQPSPSSDQPRQPLTFLLHHHRPV
jgi:hypothetical protein